MMILNIIFSENVLLLLSHGGNTRTGEEMRTEWKFTLRADGVLAPMSEHA